MVLRDMALGAHMCSQSEDCDFRVSTSFPLLQVIASQAMRQPQGRSHQPPATHCSLLLPPRHLPAGHSHSPPNPDLRHWEESSKLPDDSFSSSGTSRRSQADLLRAVTERVRRRLPLDGAVGRHLAPITPSLLNFLVIWFAFSCHFFTCIFLRLPFCNCDDGDSCCKATARLRPPGLPKVELDLTNSRSFPCSLFLLLSTIWVYFVAHETNPSVICDFFFPWKFNKKKSGLSLL